MSEFRVITNDFRSCVTERRWDVFVLMMAAFFPLHKSFTNVVMLGLLIIAVVYQSIKSSGSLHMADKLNGRYFLITAGPFLLMLLSVGYSADFKTGINYAIANSYLIVYPAVILLRSTNITRGDLRLILLSYLVACGLLLVYLHWVFAAAGLYTDFRNAEYNDMPFRAIMAAGRFHPSYVTMWFMFGSLLILDYVFVPGRSFWIRLIGVIAVTAWVLTSVLMSVKITFVAFFIALIGLLFVRAKRKRIVFAGSLALMILFVVAIVNISFLRARFIDEFKTTELKPPVGLHTNSLNMRVGIYQCAMAVFQDNWLVGTGIGDAQHDLNTCYGRFETDAYKEMDYNTHNQFLWVMISTGMIGLIAFVYCLGFHLVVSIKGDNLPFMLFIVFVSVCMLGENILSRNHGVVFYGLFCALLSRQNLQKTIGQ